MIRFEQNGAPIQGPHRDAREAAPARTPPVATPLPLTVWADDDVKYTSGTNAPMPHAAAARDAVVVEVPRSRRGDVRQGEAAVEKLAGGERDEPFSGKAPTTAKFSEPGDYVLHVTANDYSGDGGGGFVCCWTTALVKVAVK